MFNSKDYQFVADVINRVIATETDSIIAVESHRATARAFADAFERESKYFRRDVFLREALKERTGGPVHPLGLGPVSQSSNDPNDVVVGYAPPVPSSILERNRRALGLHDSSKSRSWESTPEDYNDD